MPIPGVPSWIGDLDHLNGLDEAALATDTAGQIIFANTTARRLYRFLGPDLSRVTLAEGLLPEGEHETFVDVLAQALAGKHWAGLLEVRRVDGTSRPADVSCSPLRRDGQIVGAVCVVDDSVGERGQQRESRRIEDRLAGLGRVAAELGTAEDVESVTKIVTTQAADAVGATVASLSLVEADQLVLIGLRGGREGAANRWASFPVANHTPAGDVVRTGEMLVLIGREAIDERYPDLESAAPGERTIIALPLRLVGRTIGVFTLSFPGRREVDTAELEFLGILADSCAQALERIRAQGEAADQAARVRFLADATTELATSLDYARTLANVARLVVPAFADWCAIDVVEDDRLHRLAVQHVDPAKVELAHELQRRYPPEREAPSGPWEVIRTGRSLLVPEITEDVLRDSGADEEQLDLVRELQLRSFMLVPLVARGRVFGVITWVMAESGRSYTESDLPFAEDLGRRAAIAIDNAQLHSETRQAAVRLQRAVLPDHVADVPGWELAAHYSPAGRTEVGGDFYDVVGLPDGRVALFVGDVMGRGVQAAAAMAQMRSALRAYLAIDPDPVSVCRKLDVLFETYDMAQLVTLVYLVADPSDDTLTFVNAGHPPPVLLRSDGSTETLPMATGAPFGTVPGDREAVTVRFGAGDALLAFTDGLVERRDEDIDEGLRRLLAAAPALAAGWLPERLDRLVDEVRDHSRQDDVAALVVRRSAPARP